jgi:hypothetical protein
MLESRFSLFSSGQSIFGRVTLKPKTYNLKLITRLTPAQAGVYRLRQGSLKNELRRQMQKTASSTEEAAFYLHSHFYFWSMFSTFEI